MRAKHFGQGKGLLVDFPRMNVDGKGTHVKARKARPGSWIECVSLSEYTAAGGQSVDVRTNGPPVSVRAQVVGPQSVN